MEYFLDEGVAKIGGIQDMSWLSLWKRFGWKVSIHGEAEDFNGRDWVPAYFDVTEQAAAGAARWGKLEQSILVRKGGPAPFVSQVNLVRSSTTNASDDVEA